jgi:hypothetical protein
MGATKVINDPRKNGTIEENMSSKYNPFIHGTTSATLALLPHTKFQLLPTLMMLDEHQIAPLVGEMDAGGYKELGDEPIKDSFLGAISFGTLVKGPYDLSKVITGYTKFAAPTPQICLDKFHRKLQDSLTCAFSSLNLLLIYFARARQTHQSLEEVIEPNQIENLRKQLHATVQFYYFTQLLGTYIKPNFEVMEAVISDFPDKCKDILDAAFSALTFENIVKKILSDNINMKEIFLMPTEENLSRALQVLELPQKCTSHTGRKIELSTTQFFGLKSNYVAKEGCFMTPSFFSNFLKNESGWGINRLLERFLNKDLPTEFHKKLTEGSAQHIRVLEERIELFEKLVNSKEKFGLNSNPEKSVKEQFPVIFVSQSDKILSFESEFRSKKPLQLGEEIRMVATDNEAHRSELRRYFQKHKLYSIQVVLISDLEAAAELGASALPLSIDTPQFSNFLSLTRTTTHSHLFYRFYEQLSELNEKRNQFRKTNPQAFAALDTLFKSIDKAIESYKFSPETFTPAAIGQLCKTCKEHIQEQKSILEQHRGVLGILDTALTVLTSLIILYPAVYLYQKSHHTTYTFFGTDSSAKANCALAILDEIAAAEINLNSKETSGLIARLKTIFSIM